MRDRWWRRSETAGVDLEMRSRMMMRLGHCKGGAWDGGVLGSCKHQSIHLDVNVRMNKLRGLLMILMMMRVLCEE